MEEAVNKKTKKKRDGREYGNKSDWALSPNVLLITNLEQP